MFKRLRSLSRRWARKPINKELFPSLQTDFEESAFLSEFHLTWNSTYSINTLKGRLRNIRRPFHIFIQVSYKRENPLEMHNLNRPDFLRFNHHWNQSSSMKPYVQKDSLAAGVCLLVWVIVFFHIWLFILLIELNFWDKYIFHPSTTRSMTHCTLNYQFWHIALSNHQC